MDPEKAAPCVGVSATVEHEGGRGSIGSMSRQTVLVGAGVAAAVLALLLWAPWSDREPTPGAASGPWTDPAARDPLLRGTARDGSGDRKAGTTAAYVVRGQAYGGGGTPAADTRVIARAYEGVVKGKTPILETELVADVEGFLAWEMPRPTGALFLTFAAQGTSATDACLALPDTDAPTLSLFVYHRDAQVKGVVTDIDGRPIDGAQVISGYQEPPVACEADGSFAVAVASVHGSADVVAFAPGYAQKRVTLQVPSKGSVVDVQIRLTREFRVVGTVTDPSGTPVEGAVVQSFMTSATNEARTDTRGAYVLAHLDPGRTVHAVFARHPDYAEVRREVATQGDEIRADFQLPRGVRVTGRVTNEEGTPLVGASLYIGFSAAAYNRMDATSDEDGAFAFPVVPPGQQSLVARRPGYAPVRLPLAVPKHTDVVRDVRVVLSRGRAVAGTVTFEDGRPASGLTVSWRHQREYIEGPRIRTDDRGRFAGTHLPFEGLDAEVWGDGVERQVHDVPDGRDAVRDWVIVVQPNGRLAGRVIDAATGEPISVFTVRLVRARPPEGEVEGVGYAARWGREGHRVHNAQGRWTTGTEELTIGAYYGVEVSAKGYGAATNHAVRATANPKKDSVEFALRPEARISGRLIDVDTGDAVSGRHGQALRRAEPDPVRRLRRCPRQEGGRSRTTRGRSKSADFRRARPT